MYHRITCLVFRCCVMPLYLLRYLLYFTIQFLLSFFKKIKGMIDKYSTSSGFWGNGTHIISPSLKAYYLVTSSVDWCEKNYERTHYIAEFFNSISSFAMIVVGLYGILAHRNFITFPFIAMFFTTVIVGF